MLSINTDDIRDIQAAYQTYDRDAIWMAAGFKLPLLWEWYLQNDFPDGSKLLARWEYEIALLDFKGKLVFGYVYSANSSTDGTGAFPDAENVPQEAWEYIRGRAESTSNAFLKARYSHLLWNAPRGVKAIRWGAMAIDSYLAAIGYLRQNHREQPDFNAGLLIGRLFETLVALNRTATHGRSAVQALAQELLFNTPWDFHSKNSIASTMIEQPKYLGKMSFRAFWPYMKLNFVGSAARVKMICLPHISCQ